MDKDPELRQNMKQIYKTPQWMPSWRRAARKTLNRCLIPKNRQTSLKYCRCNTSIREMKYLLRKKTFITIQKCNYTNCQNPRVAKVLKKSQSKRNKPIVNGTKRLRQMRRLHSVKLVTNALIKGCHNSKMIFLVVRSCYQLSQKAYPNGTRKIRREP